MLLGITLCKASVSSISKSSKMKANSKYEEVAVELTYYKSSEEPTNS